MRNRYRENETLRCSLVVVLLCVSVLGAVWPVSCRLTENGITLVTTDTTAPKVLDFAATSADTLRMTCSEAVTLEQARVVLFSANADSDTAADDATDDDAVPVAHITYAESGTVVHVALSEPSVLGERYLFCCTVRDESGNTLEYSRQFVGYNDHPAQLVLSELRFTHSAATAAKRKAEFIELYVLGGGNTAGLVLYGGYYGGKMQYAFPAMEVQAGEYITVHTRTYYDASQDETGDNLALPQPSPDASSTGRDLWLRGDNSFITKTDVVVVLNTIDDSLQDALLVRENDTKTAWTRTLQKDLAARAYAEGVWSAGCTPSEAVTGTALLSRTLARQNIAQLTEAYAASTVVPLPAAPSDWRVVTTATPGAANSSE